MPIMGPIQFVGVTNDGTLIVEDLHAEGIWSVRDGGMGERECTHLGSGYCKVRGDVIDIDGDLMTTAGKRWVPKCKFAVDEEPPDEIMYADDEVYFIPFTSPSGAADRSYEMFNQDGHVASFDYEVISIHKFRGTLLTCELLYEGPRQGLEVSTVYKRRKNKRCKFYTYVPASGALRTTENFVRFEGDNFLITRDFERFSVPDASSIVGEGGNFIVKRRGYFAEIAAV